MMYMQHNGRRMLDVCGCITVPHAKHIAISVWTRTVVANCSDAFRLLPPIGRRVTCIMDTTAYTCAWRCATR